MEQPLFDIMFNGELVEGTDTKTAKQNLAKLFKSTPESMDKLFTGKPQVLKRGVDKAEALKYKAALHKAGVLARFKAHQTDTTDTAPPPPSQATAPQIAAKPASQTAPTEQSNTADEDWSLAPTGSELLKANEKKPIVNADIDTSSIKLVSAFMEPVVEQREAPPAPDTSHFSVAGVGEDLLAEKPEAPPPLPLDLDSLSLAPAGSDLEELHYGLPEVNPDTSYLSIAEAGADLLEGQQKQEPPPPPDTSHLRIKSTFG